MRLEHDPQADAAYVYVSDEDVTRTDRVDQDRAIDYGANGQIVGYDFMNVRRGVRVDDLEHSRQLSETLCAAGIDRAPTSPPLSVRTMHERRAG